MSRIGMTNTLVVCVLLALVLVSVACDEVVSGVEDDGYLSTRTAAFENGRDGPGALPLLDCEIPPGPWSRGAILGVEEFLEVAALLREQCPQLDIESRIRRDAESMFSTEAQVPSTPETFCRTGLQPSLITDSPVPGRVEEMAVVEARFASDVDLTARLRAFRTPDLVDPRSIEALVGVDGTWRPSVNYDDPTLNSPE